MKRHKAQQARLHRLASLLQRMQPLNRRQAIMDMPASSRAALLEFMTLCQVPGQAKPKPALKVTKVTRSSRRCSGLRCARSQAPHGCVRTVRPGALQATICFWRILVRSATTRCPHKAGKFRAALARMCQLAMRPGADSLEERIGQAKDVALVEAGLTEAELRPSYATIVSSGSVAGAFESPTTASLSQALAWRRRLSAARFRGWPELRNAWVQVLRETRVGFSRPLSACKAAERVDAAWRKQAERRQRLEARKVPREAKLKKLVGQTVLRLGLP
ncbi:unnamed protein product [Effrenium voratum]|nr:unnamed protein product [Effrenium voratum]